MTSYTSLVNGFVAQLKGSPDTIMDLYNELFPKTLCAIEKRTWEPMDDYDTEDLPVETMTQAQMRAKLAEDGWEEAEMVDTLKGVAIDDSYALSAFLDISDPLHPIVVMPCDWAPFSSDCEDGEYLWGGVLRWRAIQEYAATLAAAKMVAVTMDCSVLSFPLPTVAGGKRGLVEACMCQENP